MSLMLKDDHIHTTNEAESDNYLKDFKKQKLIDCLLQQIPATVK